MSIFFFFLLVVWDCLSPLNIHGFLVKYQLTVFAWVYLSAFDYVLLLYMSILIPTQLWLALLCNLNSGNSYLQHYSCFSDVLAIQNLLCLHTNFRVVFSTSVKKKCWNLNRDYIKSVDVIEQYGNVKKINFFDSLTCDIFPFI